MKPSDQNKRKSFSQNFRWLIEEKAFDYFSFLSIFCFQNVIKGGKGDPEIMEFKKFGF
jgi:hypothetical protein